MKGAAVLAGDPLFKVTILNRGNTDGLIRSKGTIQISGLSTPIPIVRTTEPKAKKSNSIFGSAVPVAVTNPPELIREGSVGKIQRDSMAEFWFAPEREELALQVKKSAARAMQTGQLNQFHLVLWNHENERIRYVSPGQEKQGDS